MNYEEKINELLKENMTERGFEFWKALNSKIPSVWEKSTSSTKKYHKRKDGSIPNVGEHTYEMANATSKIMRMFDVEKNTTDSDLILLGVVMHDIIKYGHNNERNHTHREHDKMIADRITEKRDTYLKLFSEEQVEILTEMVRYHSGRWSADVDNMDEFDFKNYHPYVLFLHTLDMLSAADCLKF